VLIDLSVPSRLHSVPADHAEIFIKLNHISLPATGTLNLEMYSLARIDEL
jgi:hypothetical protein